MLCEVRECGKMHIVQVEGSGLGAVNMSPCFLVASLQRCFESAF